MATNMILLIVASTFVLSTNGIRNPDFMKTQSDEHMKFIRHPILPPFFGGHGLGRPAFGVGPIIGFGPFGGIVGGGSPNGGGLGFGIGSESGTVAGAGAGAGARAGAGAGAGVETEIGSGLGFGVETGTEIGSGSGFGSNMGGGGFGSGNLGGGFGFNGDSNGGTSPIGDGSFIGGQAKAALGNKKPWTILHMHHIIWYNILQVLLLFTRLHTNKTNFAYCAS